MIAADEEEDKKEEGEEDEELSVVKRVRSRRSSMAPSYFVAKVSLSRAQGADSACPTLAPTRRLRARLNLVGTSLCAPQLPSAMELQAAADKARMKQSEHACEAALRARHHTSSLANTRPEEQRAPRRHARTTSMAPHDVPGAGGFEPPTRTNSTIGAVNWVGTMHGYEVPIKQLPVGAGITTRKSTGLLPQPPPPAGADGADVLAPPHLARRSRALSSLGIPAADGQLGDPVPPSPTPAGAPTAAPRRRRVSIAMTVAGGADQDALDALVSSTISVAGGVADGAAASSGVALRPRQSAVSQGSRASAVDGEDSGSYAASAPQLSRRSSTLTTVPGSGGAASGGLDATLRRSVDQPLGYVPSSPGSIRVAGGLLAAAPGHAPTSDSGAYRRAPSMKSGPLSLLGDGDHGDLFKGSSSLPELDDAFLLQRASHATNASDGEGSGAHAQNANNTSGSGTGFAAQRRRRTSRLNSVVYFAEGEVDQFLAEVGAGIAAGGARGAGGGNTEDAALLTFLDMAAGGGGNGSSLSGAASTTRGPSGGGQLTPTRLGPSRAASSTLSQAQDTSILSESASVGARSRRGSVVMPGMDALSPTGGSVGGSGALMQRASQRPGMPVRRSRSVLDFDEVGADLPGQASPSGPGSPSSRAPSTKPGDAPSHGRRASVVLPSLVPSLRPAQGAELSLGLTSPSHSGQPTSSALCSVDSASAALVPASTGLSSRGSMPRHLGLPQGSAGSDGVLVMGRSANGGEDLDGDGDDPLMAGLVAGGARSPTVRRGRPRVGSVDEVGARSCMVAGAAPDPRAAASGSLHGAASWHQGADPDGRARAASTQPPASGAAGARGGLTYGADGSASASAGGALTGMSVTQRSASCLPGASPAQRAQAALQGAQAMTPQQRAALFNRPHPQASTPKPQ